MLLFFLLPLCGCRNAARENPAPWPIGTAQGQPGDNPATDLIAAIATSETVAARVTVGYQAQPRAGWDDIPTPGGQLAFFAAADGRYTIENLSGSQRWTGDIDTVRFNSYPHDQVLSWTEETEEISAVFALVQSSPSLLSAHPAGGGAPSYCSACEFYEILIDGQESTGATAFVSFGANLKVYRLDATWADVEMWVVFESVVLDASLPSGWNDPEASGIEAAGFSFPD